jgi:hypothetical protein
MVTPGAAFVEVLFPFHMHEVKFVHKAMALQQVERPINRYAINVRIDFARPSQDLGGVQMLLCDFDDSQDCSPLARHAQTAGHEFSLEPARGFAFGERHNFICYSIAIMYLNCTQQPSIALDLLAIACQPLGPRQ